jgi:hypothetical protein
MPTIAMSQQVDLTAVFSRLNADPGVLISKKSLNKSYHSMKRLQLIRKMLLFALYQIFPHADFRKMISIVLTKSAL